MRMWAVVRRTTGRVIVGCAVIILAHTFLLRSFSIPSPSMESTLVVGDVIVADLLTPKIGGWHRGDIAVFENPGWPGVEDSFLVKRIVALPGDHLVIADGIVTVNGETSPSREIATSEMFDVVIPDGRVWMMGDNRSNSHDSRVDGPVAMDRLTGRVFAVVAPIDHLGLPG